MNAKWRRGTEKKCFQANVGRWETDNIDNDINDIDDDIKDDEDDKLNKLENSQMMYFVFDFFLLN
jgi:hypothetical protein